MSLRQSRFSPPSFGFEEDPVSLVRALYVRRKYTSLPKGTRHHRIHPASPLGAGDFLRKLYSMHEIAVAVSTEPAGTRSSVDDLLFRNN